VPKWLSTDVLLLPPKSYSFVGLFHDECLRVLAGTVLESPDQNTRGFVVQIAVPQ
jgi:hypothetical protein